MAVDYGGLASGIGGFVKAAGDKEISAQEARERSRKLREYQEALAAREARILGTELPELSVPELARFQNVYDYTPEQLQTMSLEESALAGYQADPAMVQQQMDVLRQLGQLSQGGLSEGDKLAIEQAQLEASRADRGRQEAILQSMARRGVGGSGAELASRLQSAQGTSDQAAEASRSAQIQASQRALQALAQQGSMAGQLRGQQFGEAQAVADARDRIALANFQNRQRVAESNVGARNLAAQQRGQMAQNIANINTQTTQQQQMMTPQFAQQQYQNQLERERLLGNVESQPFTMGRDDASQRAQSNRRVLGQTVDSATGIMGSII